MSGLPLDVPFAGRYRLLEELGRGTTSVVYRATDAAGGPPVAVKVLDGRLTWDPRALERLRREALISRRVSHEGVVRVHDFAEDAGRAAVVQELVDGRSVASLLEVEGALPVRRACRLTIDMLEAISACHGAGILHRDVKPGNVLVDAADRARLVDFGIARVALMTTVTRTGALLGTPGYQSPEVLRGDRPDLRCDLYGVGLVLHEMLTGRPAFAGGPPELVPLRQLSGAPPPVRAVRPDVPEWLDALVSSLLHPDPERRPEDALAVMEALRRGAPPRGAEERGTCRGCAHRRRTTIPACPRCGLSLQLELGAGSHYVRLRGIERPAELAAQLRSLFGDAVRAGALHRLETRSLPSAILVRGVDEASARALAEDARRFGGGVELGRGLSGYQLREGVPGTVLLAGLAGAATIPLAVTWLVLQGPLASLVWGHPWLHGAAGGALAAGMLAAAAHLAARPVLDAAALRRRERREIPAPFLRAARRLGAVPREASFGGPLALAVEAAWEAREAAATAGDGGAARAIEESLEGVLTLAERAGALDALAAERPVPVVVRDLERAELRARTDAALSPLARALAEELAAVEEADALLSASSSRFVLTAAQLRRHARALRDRGPAEGPSLAELARGVDVDLDTLAHAVARMSEARHAGGRAAAPLPPDRRPGSSGARRTAR